MKLPEGLNAGELNRRLFEHGAAILEGIDCHMAPPHAKDPSHVRRVGRRQSPRPDRAAPPLAATSACAS
jgi:hypothetical protein